MMTIILAILLGGAFGLLYILLVLLNVKTSEQCCAWKI